MKNTTAHLYFQSFVCGAIQGFTHLQVPIAKCDPGESNHSLPLLEEGRHAIVANKKCFILPPGLQSKGLRVGRIHNMLPIPKAPLFIKLFRAACDVG